MISNLLGLGLALVPLATAPIMQENVIYNDSSYSITLEVSKGENLYAYENFFNLVHGYFYEQQPSIEDFYVNTYQLDAGGEHSIQFYDTIIIDNNDLVSSYVPYSFATLTSNNDLLTIETDIVITTTSTYYEQVKTAIEQDLTANQTNTMPSVTDLFSIIGQGITAFAGALGSAFNAVVALFWADGAPTFVGLLMLVGIGAGLIYLTYRMISGLVKRLRG